MDIEAQRFRPRRAVARYRRAAAYLSPLGAYELAREVSKRGYTPTGVAENITKYFKRKASGSNGGNERPRKKARSSREAKEEDTGSNKDMGKRARRYHRSATGSRRNPRFTKKIGKRNGGRKRGKKLVIVSKRQVKKWNTAAKNAKIDIGTTHDYFREHLQTSCIANGSRFQISANYTVTQLVDFVASNSTWVKDTTTNPATISGPVNPQPSAAAQQQQKYQLEIQSKGCWFNNNAQPFWVDVYCWTPKGATALQPEVAFQAGLTDKGSTDFTSPFVYPSHSDVLMKSWKIQSHKRVCLAPGESVTLYFRKKVKYDPSFVDSQTDIYQEALGSHAYCVRLEGCVGHSLTTPANVGTAIAKVDFIKDQHVIFKYSADMQSTRYIFTTPDSAQTGGTVIGWPSDADNTIGTTS